MIAPGSVAKSVNGPKVSLGAGQGIAAGSQMEKVSETCVPGAVPGGTVNVTVPDSPFTGIGLSVVLVN